MSVEIDEVWHRTVCGDCGVKLRYKWPDVAFGIRFIRGGGHAFYNVRCPHCDSISEVDKPEDYRDGED